VKGRSASGLGDGDAHGGRDRDVGRARALLAPLASPILRTFGGVCLVSDAEWLLH